MYYIYSLSYNSISINIFLIYFSFTWINNNIISLYPNEFIIFYNSSTEYLSSFNFGSISYTINFPVDISIIDIPIDNIFNYVFISCIYSIYIDIILFESCYSILSIKVPAEYIPVISLYGFGG